VGGCVYLRLLIFELQGTFDTQRVEGILDRESEDGQSVWEGEGGGRREGGSD